MTVAGFTKISTSRQPDQMRESQAQRIRSAGRSLDWIEVRWQTLTQCLGARISTCMASRDGKRPWTKAAAAHRIEAVGMDRSQMYVQRRRATSGRVWSTTAATGKLPNHSSCREGHVSLVMRSSRAGNLPSRGPRPARIDRPASGQSFWELRRELRRPRSW